MTTVHIKQICQKIGGSMTLCANVRTPLPFPPLQANQVAFQNDSRLAKVGVIKSLFVCDIGLEDSNSYMDQFNAYYI